ncbi:MAG: Cys-tRNA(Pro) deacylase [Thiohalophilus sp.]|uniref:Cys-tRNA(Pro) deacylase n=1 Tax=Thiohalophilus sp. TaxID=3028392 RepID=UPI00286FB58F|nr:Cys-tRNA(Pro) deacylase [Thiohalophilus sp.]MDR9436185.1 Cys-tRNA(Pro) deacylase [Thiohalophilus sp.]
MTPAIEIARKARIRFTIHEYTHDPAAESYGLEAVEQLGVEPARVFKTLLVSLLGSGSMLAVGIVPVDKQLDLKSMAAAAGAKKARLADSWEAERVTGYVLGGISPLGQKKRLLTILDETVMNYETIYVSAGRRGLEIELWPVDLRRLTDGTLAAIAR